MSVYLDLTEFFHNPITTGIQRISGELCKYAPEGTLIPVRLGAHGYLAFSSDLIKTVAAYFARGTEAGAGEIRRLSSIEKGKQFTLSARDTVLVPEVFGDPPRLEFFRELSDADLKRFRFIVFDMLPLTHPQYFWAGTWVYEYFRIVRRATHCGFISEETRENYYHRAKRMRADGGIILPLGCDALGPRPTTPVLDRPLAFSVVGTVEPRKNHRLILDAFEPLLRSIPGLTLSFVGRMGWVSPDFSQKIHTLEADPKSGFRFFSTPGDEALRKCIEYSRATIYLSAGEGYGLPPVESLWVGTPVIASNASPSLKPLGSAGIHIVEPLDIVNTREAILAFVDNRYANQKTLEASSICLPTWQLFAEEVMRWVQSR